MTREEYVAKQQELREKHHEVKNRYRDEMDHLADDHAEKVRIENESYRESKKELKDRKAQEMMKLHYESEMLHNEWCKEHPYPEVVIIDQPEVA